MDREVFQHRAKISSVVNSSLGLLLARQGDGGGGEGRGR
jgi:hypothetical protein